MADVDLNELIDTADSSSHKPKKIVHKHLAHKTAEHSDVKHAPRPSSGGNAAVWVLSIVSVVLIGLLVASILTNGFKSSSSSGVSATASPSEVKAKTLAYLAALAPGQQISVDEVTDNGTLYTVKITLAGKSYNSFASKDGVYLFPSGIDLNQKIEPAAAAAAPTPVPKTDKPVVELFVMAYCPYGTQAEKGILPAVRALGDKVDFKVRFVYYSMHGQKEVTENLDQYCIQKEQTSKYTAYLACFLNASDAAGCKKSAGIDEAKLKICTDAADKQFNVTANFNDKSSWLSGSYPLFNIDANLNTKYSVQGSPTLVINGVQSNAGRDSASFLKGICAAFNNAPSECGTQLSATSPGPGFGYDSTSAATAAGCGV